MKKRILLALAILSTVAFGETVTGTIEGTISGNGMSASKDITLTGRAVKAVELNTEVSTVDFGTVLLGRTSTADVVLVLNGEKDFNVEFVATDLTAKKVKISGLDKVKLTGENQDITMNLVYTPTATTDNLENTTLTVTATYAD